jgi:hypothetical protein
MFVTDATNLPRLMACNGSRLMEPAGRSDGEVDTTVRDEGNAAHYMAQAIFNGEFNIEELIERKAPNGIYMTPEMSEHVQWYLDGIRDAPGNVEVDTSYGTDAWRINSRADHIGEANNTLYVDELKYGWRLVDPENNWTMIWHAIGYCITRQIQPDNIIFTVHQPRPYHPEGKRRFTHLSYADLLQRFAEIQATMTTPDNALRTGWHCHGCPALATCPAARSADMNALDMVELQAFSDEIDNTQLSFTVDQLTRAIAMLESRLAASKELIMYRLRSGQIIDNYSIEPTFSNTRWKEHVTRDMLLMLTAKDLSSPKLLTPKQAKKAGASAELVDALTERTPTGFKLVRISADKKAKRLLGDKDDD